MLLPLITEITKKNLFIKWKYLSLSLNQAGEDKIKNYNWSMHTYVKNVHICPLFAKFIAHFDNYWSDMHL